MTKANARGYHDAIQDLCENAPFASVGGLDHRSAMRAPDYVAAGDVPDYLDGYCRAAREMYGDDWETCPFMWRRAVVLAGRATT